MHHVARVGSRLAALIEQAGLQRRSSGPAQPGDLLLVQAGPGQLHLAVRTGYGFIHADTGLRRVVEAPSITTGTILGIWQGGES